jgi:hypothetical protein
MTFGPSSVFPGKIKKEPISRMASSSNMFSMLSSQTAESVDAKGVFLGVGDRSQAEIFTIPFSS